MHSKNEICMCGHTLPAHNTLKSGRRDCKAGGCQCKSFLMVTSKNEDEYMIIKEKRNKQAHTLPFLTINPPQIWYSLTARYDKLPDGAEFQPANPENKHSRVLWYKDYGKYKVTYRGGCAGIYLFDPKSRSQLSQIGLYDIKFTNVFANATYNTPETLVLPSSRIILNQKYGAMGYDVQYRKKGNCIVFRAPNNYFVALLRRKSIYVCRCEMGKLDTNLRILAGQLTACKWKLT